VEITIRKLVVAIVFFFLLLFFMIPIGFVNSLANLQGLAKTFPILNPLLNL
jgi:hypothetical protein